MPAKQRAVAMSIEVKNESGEHRSGTLGLDIRAGVARMTHKNQWWSRFAELDNRITADATRGCLIFAARHSEAVSVQGISPPPDRIEQGRMLVREFLAGAGRLADAALSERDRRHGREERWKSTTACKRIAGNWHASRKST